jgi:hypothetical protein
MQYDVRGRVIAFLVHGICAVARHVGREPNIVDIERGDGDV